MTGESTESPDSQSSELQSPPPQKLNRIKKPKSMPKPKIAPSSTQIAEPSLEEEVPVTADSADKFDSEAVQNKAKKVQSLATKKMASKK